MKQWRQDAVNTMRKMVIDGKKTKKVIVLIKKDKKA